MKRESLTTIVALVLLAVLAGVYVMNREEEPKRSPVTQITATDITAEALYNAYAENKVAADQRYKNQVIAVSGTVQSITTFGDEPVVNIAAHAGRGGVQCYLEKDQENRAATLKPGQQVTIKGLCKTFINNVVLVEKGLIP